MVQQESGQREAGQNVEAESKVPPRYVDPRLRRKFPASKPANGGRGKRGLNTKITESAEGDVPVLASSLEPQQERSGKIVAQGYRYEFDVDIRIKWERALQAGPRHEWWLKGGPPTDTLPADTEWYQQLFLGAFTRPEAKSVLDERIERVKEAWEQVSHGVEQKYIIPRSAMERYIREGVSNLDHYEALFPEWRAPNRERVARIEKLISFLQFDNYQLALTELDCDEIWWGMVDKEGVTSRQDLREVWWGIFGSKEIILELFPRHHAEHPFIARFAASDPAGMSQFLQRNISRYDQLWERLPSESKNKDRIVHWLKELIGEISV